MLGSPRGWIKDVFKPANVLLCLCEVLFQRTMQLWRACVFNHWRQAFLGEFLFAIVGIAEFDLEQRAKVFYFSDHNKSPFSCGHLESSRPSANCYEGLLQKGGIFCRSTLPHPERLTAPSGSWKVAAANTSARLAKHRWIQSTARGTASGVE